MSLMLVWLISIVATVVIADRKGLNRAGYFVFALVFGPAALLIVALDRARSKEGVLDGRITNIEDARQQLAVFKADIERLNVRARFLEERISHLSAGAGSESPSSSPMVESVAAANSSSRSTARASNVSSKKNTADQKPSSDHFEIEFGKYWLNRLGVVIFVIGVGLFISYTFQYLHAGAKIAMGYALAASFFFWGERLSRSSRWIKMSWGISGGAWGLLYLTTYALHFIAATRVVDSPVIALLLLAAVSGTAIFFNLKHNSWVVSSITYLLAFLTAGLGGLAYSTIGYYTMVVGSLAFVALRRGWWNFLALGLVAAYVTLGWWADVSAVGWLFSFMDPVSARPAEEARILFISAAVTWGIFTLVLQKMKAPASPQDGGVGIAAPLMNAGFFAGSGFHLLERMPQTGIFIRNEQFLFLMLLSVLYLLLFAFDRQTKKASRGVLHLCLASVLFMLAVWVREPMIHATVFWSLEMIALFVIGVYCRDQIYRILAAIFSVFILFKLLADSGGWFVPGTEPVHGAVFLFVGGTLLAMGLGSASRVVVNCVERSERDYYQWLFSIAGTLLLVLYCHDVAGKWLPVMWALLGSGILVLGFIFTHRVIRYAGLGVLALTTLRVLTVDVAGLNTIYKIVGVTLLGLLFVGISFIYSNRSEGDEGREFDGR